MYSLCIVDFGIISQKIRIRDSFNCLGLMHGDCGSASKVFFCKIRSCRIYRFFLMLFNVFCLFFFVVSVSLSFWTSFLNSS